MSPAADISEPRLTRNEPSSVSCALPAGMAGRGGVDVPRRLPDQFPKMRARQSAHVVREAFQTSQAVRSVPHVSPQLPGLGRVLDRLLDRSLHVRRASVRPTRRLPVGHTND